MMYSAELREQQATACLKAAEVHYEKLLAVSVKLHGGEEEAAKDFFHQVIMNCHDAIQRNGFDGQRYEFYLLASLRNHYKREKSRTVPTCEITPELAEGLSTEGGLSPQARQHLVDQLATEVRQNLSFTDRVLLRLHADGISYRDISAMTGAGEHSWLRRRIERLKNALRATFGETWDGLDG
jgi:DNA-directed RNA polymerase specialized sigma24 family protein